MLKLGDLELDEDKYEVWRAGHAITLTPTEFKLLRYLMLNPRRVVSKSQILDHVWEYDFGGDAGIVETYVSYLRKKLDVGRRRHNAHPDAARRRVHAAPRERLRRRCRCAPDWRSSRWSRWRSHS